MLATTIVVFSGLGLCAAYVIGFPYLSFGESFNTSCQTTSATDKGSPSLLKDSLEDTGKDPLHLPNSQPRMKAAMHM